MAPAPAATPARVAAHLSPYDESIDYDTKGAVLDALGVIGTSVYILRRRLGDDPGVARHIERIAEHVERCREAIIEAQRASGEATT